jgi:tetratricopeptide (TPR) repeat protein
MYQLLVAEVAGQRGQLDVAVVNYLAAAEASRDAGIAERATRVALYAQALREALSGATLWVELAPENAEARQIAASLLLAFGRAPEAVTHFERFIELSADRPDHGLLSIAGQLAGEKNRVAALAVMDKLLESRPDDPYGWLAHAQLTLRQANLELALRSVDRALALKPEWPQAVVLRAQILSLQGDKAGALEYLKGLLKGKLGDDPAVGLSYARLLAENEQLDAALAQFERLVKQAPDSVEVHFAVGVLALQAKDFDKAQRHLEKVLSLGQRLLEANYYLGRLFETKGDVDNALRHYYAVRHGEYYLSAHSRAASLLADQGKLDRARELLHALETDDPQERLRLYLVEGELLRRAGLYQEAFDFYTEKLAQMPQDTALRYARALVAERLDKLTMAEEDLRAIIDREPGNAQALNALGYTLADRTDRYEEALGFIQRALEANPGDAAIIDSMGWVQFRMGNHEQAVEYLRKALALIDDPEIAAHLSEVLWVMGDKQEARKLWDEFLGKFPEHESLLEVKQRLGQ